MTRTDGSDGEVVFLQASPFCNIDCDYCYLPERNQNRRMTFETLRRSLELVREIGCANGVYCLVWHVGEPLAIPSDWYREAHRVCEEVLGGSSFEIHYQTNGTLISPRWIDFFRSDPRIQLSVSIDGPAFIHDLHRRTRRGGGTHRQAMRGIELLKNAGISFDCISVATESTLDHPDAFYDFFAEVGPRILSINAESVTGANRTSSINGEEAEYRYRRFLRRLAERHLRERRFVVRNFLWAQLKLRAELQGEAVEGCRSGNRLNRPWKLLSIDWKGDFHTFSPSLLGMNVPPVGRALGNVWRDRFSEVARSEKFRQLESAVRLGVEACRQSCPHFARCGGGSPSHKWFEHGSFGATETSHCRTGVQSDWVALWEAAEAHLGDPA